MTHENLHEMNTPVNPYRFGCSRTMLNELLYSDEIDAVTIKCVLDEAAMQNTALAAVLSRCYEAARQAERNMVDDWEYSNHSADLDAHHYATAA